MLKTVARRMLAIILVLLALPLFCQRADTTILDTTGLLRAKVVGVHDGDTYYVRDLKGKRFAVRIGSVDAPEIYAPKYILKTQPYGRESGDSVRSFLKGQWVWLDTLAFTASRTVYEKHLADIHLVDGGFLALILCEKGWAWPSSEVPRRRRDGVPKMLENAFKGAKKAKLGVYSQLSRPVHPKTWKRRFGFKK